MFAPTLSGRRCAYSDGGRGGSPPTYQSITTLPELPLFIASKPEM
jgi:hypothetical protein